MAVVRTTEGHWVQGPTSSDPENAREAAEADAKVRNERAEKLGAKIRYVVADK